ncbi:aspartate-semialdehyde dehydrogenase domain protein [Leptospira interrogans serovar Bataviae str. HAI135]|nr:aspartate-semialdehyde dehydrogenase domain protein [Leptospira interrogans serovar Bataviae str. HAI135]
MTTVIGRLRQDPIFDWKYVVLSHNTIRGAAGAALLNAELPYKKISWDNNVIPCWNLNLLNSR